MKVLLVDLWSFYVGPSPCCLGSANSQCAEVALCAIISSSEGISVETLSTT